MSKPPTTIKDLFPDLSPEDEKEAEENLRRYFAFIVRLYDRIVSDPHELERLKALTRTMRGHSMGVGRSFTSQTQDTEV